MTSVTGRAEENCECETSDREEKRQHDQEEEMGECVKSMSIKEGKM